MISHLLALVLIVALPVCDRFETRRLKTSRDPRVKIQSYQLTIGWLWSSVAIAVPALGWRTLFTIQAGGAVQWLPSGVDLTAFGFGLGATFLVAGLLPVLVALRSSQVRERLQKQLAPLSFFLPLTTTERGWFALVCVSAGICEEVLFRGFLIHYFQWRPYDATLGLALGLSCLFFGTAHLYQGFGGVLQTALLGLIFGSLFLVTGNILLPVILHTTTDLKLLLLLPKPGKPFSGNSTISP